MRSWSQLLIESRIVISTLASKLRSLPDSRGGGRILALFWAEKGQQINLIIDSFLLGCKSIAYLTATSEPGR